MWHVPVFHRKSFGLQASRASQQSRHQQTDFYWGPERDERERLRLRTERNERERLRLRTERDERERLRLRTERDEREQLIPWESESSAQPPVDICLFVCGQHKPCSCWSWTRQTSQHSRWDFVTKYWQLNFLYPAAPVTLNQAANTPSPDLTGPSDIHQTSRTLLTHWRW